MRDARETLVSLRNVDTALSRIQENWVMKNYQPEKVECSPVVPEPLSVTVGLDLPLKELKMKLLKDERVSTLVLTAAGGCGKTTLAKKFCRDQEVKVLVGSLSHHESFPHMVMQFLVNFQVSHHTQIRIKEWAEEQTTFPEGLISEQYSVCCMTSSRS
ncbi:probable disease resistance protein At5g66910 [Malus domestica]|uniref:probable disease resistance protein At5g66910 n=1 Tax=Malus domestica TaxID=3750 RepID=UPI000498D5C7